VAILEIEGFLTHAQQVILDAFAQSLI